MPVETQPPPADRSRLGPRFSGWCRATGPCRARLAGLGRAQLSGLEWTLLLVLGALALPGCRALPEFDWNPLMRLEHTEDGAVEVEALGPIWDYRDGPEGVSHALRPLYQHKANFGLPVTDFLAPFGRRFEVRDGSRWRFWPLIWSGRTQRTEAGTAWNTVVFPFIFAGGGPENGDGYFAFWPLGGRTRGVFGIDTYDFAIWPLFMRTRMDVTERSTSWTVLLLGGWTSGGPRDGSWRVLPFYRRRLVRDPEGNMRTDQRTVLWPFFTWGRDYMDEDDPSYRFGFWPLFSHERAQRWSKTTWLWPFFRVNSQTDPPPKEGGQFLYDLPWPFFRWARSKESTTFRVWPFYTRHTSEELDSTAFLIPLGWWRISKGFTGEQGLPMKAYRRSDLWLLPFWHNSRRTVADREGEDTTAQLWPLFHADSEVNGSSHAAFFSIVPARNWEFLRPADELYGPFFTLWRHRTTAETRETRLALDTTFWRHETQGVRVSIPFVYSRRPMADEATRHGVLWGLFGARTDEQGLSALSLAGFDLWTR